MHKVHTRIEAQCGFCVWEWSELGFLFCSSSPDLKGHIHTRQTKPVWMGPRCLPRSPPEVFLWAGENGTYPSEVFFWAGENGTSPSEVWTKTTCWHNVVSPWFKLSPSVVWLQCNHKVSPDSTTLQLDVMDCRLQVDIYLQLPLTATLLFPLNDKADECERTDDAEAQKSESP